MCTIPDGRGWGDGLLLGELGRFLQDANMREPELNWQMADDYLAEAEVVRPKYRVILLDILERYCEIELGAQPPHIRKAIRRLNAKQSPTIN